MDASGRPTTPQCRTAVEDRVLASRRGHTSARMRGLRVSGIRSRPTRRHDAPTMPIDDAYAVRTSLARRHDAAFWAVAFAFLIVMAVATLPRPLFRLFRGRGHLSALAGAVVYAGFS